MHLFFFNDTATTEIYTLSLHDALPIYRCEDHRGPHLHAARRSRGAPLSPTRPRRPSDLLRNQSPAMPGFFACNRTDRKSTRLNSSHLVISYAVFCLKKKKTCTS